MKRPGKYVKYTDKDGKTQKAVAYNDEQSREFTSVKKVFIRLIDDDFKFKKDPENGKNIISLKQASELTFIGFVD